MAHAVLSQEQSRGLSAQERINQAADKIRSLQRSIASDAIEIGNELITVKSILPHGEFGKWLDSEFGWNERTARRMMQAAEVFKTDTVSDLSIDQTALYTLSADSCPESATKEALRLAKKGEHITNKTACRIRDKHTGAAEKRKQRREDFERWQREAQLLEEDRLRRNEEHERRERSLHGRAGAFFEVVDRLQSVSVDELQANASDVQTIVYFAQNLIEHLTPYLPEPEPVNDWVDELLNDLNAKLERLAEPTRKALATLGLTQGATAEQVLAAYYRRAAETHPDHGGDKKEFADVQAAYELLIERKRAGQGNGIPDRP